MEDQITAFNYTASMFRAHREGITTSEGV